MTVEKTITDQNNGIRVFNAPKQRGIFKTGIISSGER
jgi:hypothetical protein